jgi:hypothetical protein
LVIPSAWPTARIEAELLKVFGYFVKSIEVFGLIPSLDHAQGGLNVNAEEEEPLLSDGVPHWGGW